MRIEYSAAILAMMTANRYRRENDPPFKVYDFAPHHDEPELTMEELRGW